MANLYTKEQHPIPSSAADASNTTANATRLDEELHARLAAVIECSDDAIITKTLDGVIRTWNQGAERIFGYSEHEVINKHITLLIPPDRRGEEEVILNRLRNGERIEHYETVRLHKNGCPLDISLSISSIRDSRGELIAASKIARDITQRKVMERTLQEERRILELLNKTGSIISANLELQSLVQAITDSATEISGAKFGAFYYNAFNEHGDSHILHTLSGSSTDVFAAWGSSSNTPLFKPTFNGERTIRSDDITVDLRHSSVSPPFGMPIGRLPVRSYLAVQVRSRSGEVLGGLFLGHPEPGVFSERAERIVQGIAAQAAIAIDNARLYEDVKRAARERAKLLEAERAARTEAERVSLMKDEFLATLSHELRTPLTAILGWSQLLSARTYDDQDLQEGIEIIDRNARMQTQLIEDLLDMSRIASGKVRLVVQQVDPAEVVKAAVASVRLSAETHGIQLYLDLDRDVGSLRGDPGRLQQCVWNLLTNAIKFTPKDGWVRVSLKRVNDTVRINVCDNGRGIRPDFLPYLFERFRQADGSTTRRHGGLGLGLSIVKHLIELHGGKVTAKSEGKDLGAEFLIQLPVDKTFSNGERGCHPIQERFPRPVVDHPSLEGIKVLAVDDEPDTRNLLKRILESCGAEVILATSSVEGIEKVKAERPHVIISDIGMPDEDGYEFVRKLRQLNLEEGGKLPAAALTAFARAEDRMRALRAGFQTHITKPVEPGELTAVVASLALKV